MHDDGRATCASVKIRNGDKPFCAAHTCVNRDGSPCFAADHEPLTAEQLAERAERQRPTPAEGPGTELKAMLSALGISPDNCNCNARAAQMNRWGVAGCCEHRLEIAEWLREAAAGKVTEFAVTDPAEAFLPLVDEAIRRADCT